MERKIEEDRGWVEEWACERQGRREKETETKEQVSHSTATSLFICVMESLDYCSKTVHSFNKELKFSSKTLWETLLYILNLMEPQKACVKDFTNILVVIFLFRM